MEIGDKGQRCLEVPLHDIEAQLERREALFDVVEFPGDPLLLGSQEIERDRVGVVRLQELGSLVQRLPLTPDELLPFDSGVLAQLGDLFEDDLLGLEPEILTKLDAPVELDDFLLDVLDQQRFLAAAARVALTAEADEVGIDLPTATSRLADDQT